MAISDGILVYGVDVYGYADYGGENITAEDQTGKSGKRSSEQWEECSRCGFNYPLSQLVRQRGDGGNVIVCTVISCADESSAGDYRTARELPTEAPLKFVDGGD